MRSIVTVLILAPAVLAVSACQREAPASPGTTAPAGDPQPKVDECPRADGRACL